ncbi:MAG: Xaa-Pro peptidase family protein [Planctomycetes bacterium]|nr:Xaa-Pro peptidase family protein [Planctomycetota bacterium]
MDRPAKRRDKLRSRVRSAGADSILVTSEVNVTYLTGFTGDSSYLLLTRDRQIVLSDARYEEDLQAECPGLDLEIRRPPTKMHEWVEQVVGKAKPRKMAVEADSLSVAQFDEFQKRLKGVELVKTSGLVEQLREIKDKDEIAAIRRAVRLAERAFAVIRAALRPDQTEREIAHNLEHQIRLLGGRGCAFPPIVAVGPNAALPHAQPGYARIKDSPLVLIDWGAQGRLYCSDLTRVLATAKISPKLEATYRVVFDAQRAGIEAIRPGATMAAVDAAARSVIEKAGYGGQFGHSLGHGIGLQTHESPRLAESEHRELKTGMVVTVEPGIYLPGWGGVRIEDDVLVTKDGCEVLSHTPKELAECVVQI